MFDFKSFRESSLEIASKDAFRVWTLGVILRVLDHIQSWWDHQSSNGCYLHRQHGQAETPPSCFLQVIVTALARVNCACLSPMRTLVAMCCNRGKFEIVHCWLLLHFCTFMQNIAHHALVFQECGGVQVILVLPKFGKSDIVTRQTFHFMLSFDTHLLRRCRRQHNESLCGLRSSNPATGRTLGVKHVW